MQISSLHYTSNIIVIYPDLNGINCVNRVIWEG